MVRVSLLLAAAAAIAGTPADLVTTQSVATLQHCIEARWSTSGRMIAINTAAGVMLDLAFPSVTPDGHVATGHVAFTIEDQGTQRRLSAAAADPADAVLVEQMTSETAKACLASGDEPASAP